MDKYKEIILGYTAIGYIRECLSYGLTLSKYISESVDLDTGQVMTAFPEDANLRTIYKLEYGGILPTLPESEWHRVTGKDGSESIIVPKYPFTSYVVFTIRSFLESDTERICIFEDAVARPNDSALKRRKSHFVTLQDEVYDLLTKRESSDRDIEQAIKETGYDHPPLICAMTSLPCEEHGFLARQEITSEILRVLAERTEKIIVGAYDGEGYLIWHRQSPLPE